MKIDPDGTYSIGQAARLVGLSASTLRDLERRGELGCTRTPGGQRRFSGSALLNLRDRSIDVPPKKAASSTPRGAPDPEDVKARAAWLNHLIARGQRELAGDTPAEIRFRFASDLEQALRAFGSESGGPEVDRVFTSVVERAKQQAEEADEAKVRSEMKAELIDDALTHLRRKIDTLPRRLAGAPQSYERTHIRASLREQLRNVLERRVRGDETWHEVRQWADEFLAAWYVKQARGRGVPNVAKYLAATTAGFAGGAAAAAALDPRIRAAAARLKEPLRSLVVEALNRFGAPSSPPPSPGTQPDQSAQPPRPAHPGVGVFNLRASTYRPGGRYARPIHRRPASPSGSTTLPSWPLGQSAPTNRHVDGDSAGGRPNSSG